MNLPNYFFADLPPEAELTPLIIREACHALKRNRRQYLEERPVKSLVRALAETAQAWLEPESHFRKLALEEGPARTGFSRETLRIGLDAFFSQLTSENLHALIEQDLGHLSRVEKLTATEAEMTSNRAAIARAPELLVHIAAGRLPNPTWMSMVLGVLVRSAQFVKCATGSSWLPRLFAHSLRETDAKLGACLEIAEWKGGTSSLEEVLLAEADCVTATGSDETLEAIRAKLGTNTKKRFLGYGQRVSFGYVAQEALAGLAAQKAVAHAAADVAAWDQVGCLSPHVIYVETGGKISPEQFAELLAGALESEEQKQPRGKLPPEASGNIAYRRSFYEIRAAASAETRLWQSEGSTAWTVVYEADPQFQASCLNRFIYVKMVTNIRDLLRGIDAWHEKISTAGIAAPEDRAEEIANELARWGVTRICPLGQMQNPPLLWRHDGRPALGDLVTWTDWET